jgi:hypothetical protein
LGEVEKLNTLSLISTGGDAITAGHALAGAWLAGYVLSSHEPTMTEFGAHFLASVSDMADGRVKRWCYIASAGIIARATKIESPESANEITVEQWQVMEKFGIVDHPGFDHWVDKGYYYALTAALAKRQLERGNTGTAALLGINLALTVPRDILRTLQKYEIKKLSGDNHASKLGKYKTLFQNVGIGVLLSPVERYKAGRALGVGILSVSTAMGLNDYRKNIAHVRYARQHPKEKSV